MQRMKHDTYNESFMNRAIELSRTGMLAGDGGPFGAVVTREGTIVSEGWNQVLRSNDPTAHAEIVAIREASQALGWFDLSDCEVYSSCEPCPMCLGAIYWARPKRVYYANTKSDAAHIAFDDSMIYTELELLPEHRSIPFIQIPNDRALEVFSEWSSKVDKTHY